MSLAKNSIIYLVSNMFIKATTFFLLPLYSHLVPPEIYGHIYVVSALTNFMGVFLPVSLSICISRFYFDCVDEEAVKRLYSTILLFVLISSVTVLTPLFCIRNSLSELLSLPEPYLTSALVMSFFNIFYPIILALLYVCQKAKQVSITSACIGIFQVILQLTLVTSMENKGMALLSSYLIYSFTTFVIFIVYSRPYLTLNFDFKSTGKFIKYALSQWPSDLSGWLVNFTDRIFINKYISAASAGVYGIGANIGQVPMMIFSSVNSAFTPFANGKYKEMEISDDMKAEDARKELSNVFMVVSSIMMMITTFMIVLSNNIVSLLSSAYADAYMVIVVMLISSLMNNYRCMFMAPLAYNTKYTKVKSLIWVFAGIINIGLNFYLIPRYGIYAACINSLITYTITFLLMLYYGKKAIYMEYDWIKLLKVFAFSIIYISLVLLGDNPYWLILKGVLFMPYVYYCMYYVLNINVINKIEGYVKILLNK